MKTNKPDIVYPGTPLIVAMDIMDVFDSLEEALSLDENNRSAALTHQKVRGAGDAVCAACRLLKYIDKTSSVENSYFLAVGYWTEMVGPNTGNHENQFVPGIERMREYRNTFIKRAKEWKKQQRNPVVLTAVKIK